MRLTVVGAILIIGLAILAFAIVNQMKRVGGDGERL